MSFFSDSKTANPERRTRERIMEAALRVFSQKGYHDARVDEIVEESQTSKGAVYFHFPSKEQIFLALVDDYLPGPTFLEHKPLQKFPPLLCGD